MMTIAPAARVPVIVRVTMKWAAVYLEMLVISVAVTQSDGENMVLLHILHTSYENL